MVAAIKKGGQAEANKHLRRGMVLSTVQHNELGAIDVSTHSLQQLKTLLSNPQYRPIKTTWINPPSRSLDKDGNLILQQITVRFTERMGLSLGLELVQSKKGGVLISKVVPHSPASRSNKLRKSMQLIKINSKDYTTCTLKEAIEGLSLKARRTVTFNDRKPVGGILTTWQIAPSRNLTAEGTRIVQPPTPAKTIRRRWKRAIHTVIMGIRTQKMADRRDTRKRITSWLQTDVIDKAVDIGYSWEGKTIFFLLMSIYFTVPIFFF